MYELWSQAKQEEKTEYFNYLKERVTLQHELIKQQDELFRKRKEKLEENRNQVRELLSVVMFSSLQYIQSRKTIV